MIEQLSATAPDPAFRDSILPGTGRADPCGVHARGCKQLGDLVAKLAVTIKNRIAIRARFRKCLPQLLHDPEASRVFRDVEMENFASTMFDDEETIQNSEGEGRYGKEVHRGDDLTVITQESPPETTKPSFWSSPWVLGAPQVGFSATKRRMSARISAVAFGLPARARDRHFQKSRNPARCQPTTVSGLTATRTSANRDQMRCRVIQNSRSKRFNRGRGRFRLRRMSCCRKARISKAVSFRLRKKTRTAARRARMNRSMNPSL